MKLADLLQSLIPFRLPANVLLSLMEIALHHLKTHGIYVAAESLAATIRGTVLMIKEQSLGMFAISELTELIEDEVRRHFEEVIAKALGIEKGDSKTV